jgi:TNF receptor-associated protein 1
VIDCEDLPLNISRENYQDSGLISKLRNVLTRRVIKALEDEMKLDEEKYNNWYNEFSNCIKEGVNTDSENSQQLLKLLRYKSTFSGDYCSLDDYVKKMKPE